MDKYRRIKRIGVVALMLVMVFSFGCESQEAAYENEQSDVAYSENTDQPTVYDKGSKAKAYLVDIESTIGPRVAGSESEKKTAEYLVDEAEGMGYEPIVQTFEFSDGLTASNVIIHKDVPGDEQIIVGAHYDSVDAGNGVDDNGSSVAVVLETMDALKDRETPFDVTYVFFAAEEVGKFGSDYYVSTMSDEDIENTILMVNLDSLIAGDYAYVYGNDDEKGAYREQVLKIAEEMDLDLITQDVEDNGYPYGTTGDWSDHKPFKDEGIPFIYFEATNWELGDQDGYTQVNVNLGQDGLIWHTEYDNVEYIESNFKGRIDHKLHTFTAILEQVLTHEWDAN